MSYGYGARTVWLGDLDPERSPAGYDLCTDHADGLSVPQGWERSDLRGERSDRRGEGPDRRRGRADRRADADRLLSRRAG